MTEHALIMCRETGRHSTLDKGHEEGGSAYANAGSSLRSPPGCSRASPPQKNRSLPTVLLCALTSDFTGGCPPPPSRSLCQRLNLELQFIKFLVILFPSISFNTPPFAISLLNPSAPNPVNSLSSPTTLTSTRTN